MASNQKMDFDDKRFVTHENDSKIDLVNRDIYNSQRILSESYKYDIEMLKILLWSASKQMSNNQTDKCSNIYENIINFLKRYHDLNDNADNDEQTNEYINDNWNEVCVKFENCYNDYLLFNEEFMQTGRYCEEFVELNELGCGGFGTVYKVSNKLNGNMYAIKKIPLKDYKECEKVLKELKIWAHLNTEYVVQYYSSWFESIDYDYNHIHNNESISKKIIEKSFTKSKDKNSDSKPIAQLYIQMELCSYTLKEIIDTLDTELNQKMLSYPTSIGYYIASELFLEILECVNYLHKLERPVIHRDLKPENILIINGFNGRFVKIADFGLSTIHFIDKLTHTQALGTQKYMAPEVLNCRKYNTKADVYSLGVIMKQLLNLDNDVYNNISINNSSEIDVFRTKYLCACTGIYLNMSHSNASMRPDCSEVIDNHHLWALNLNDLLIDKEFSSYQSRHENNYEDLNTKFYSRFLQQKIKYSKIHRITYETAESGTPNLLEIVDVTEYLTELFETTQKRVLSALDPTILKRELRETLSGLGKNGVFHIKPGAKVSGSSKSDFSNFKAVLNLKEFKLQVTADFHLKKLKCVGEYSLNVPLFNLFPLTENGTITFAIRNITGNISISGNLNDYKLSTDMADINMAFSTVTLCFDNLINEKLTPYLNGLANFAAKPFFNNLISNNKTETQNINNFIKNEINNELKKLNVQKIIAGMQQI